MLDLNVFRPLSLTAEQTRGLEKLMAEAHGFLLRAALEKYGTPSVRRLRDDFKAGRTNLWFDPAAKFHMARLAAAEDTVVRATIRLGAKLSQRWHARHPLPGVPLGDYLAECAAAIYDAIYMYQGGRAFSTYVTACMRNRLSDFVRRQERLVRAGSRRNLGEPETADDVGRRDELAAMRRAVAVTALTPLRRQLVEAYLSGEKGFCDRIAAERVNAKSGRAYSRQRMWQEFYAACESIRREYNSGERARAA